MPPPEVPTPHLSRRMDGRVEGLDGIGTETLGGVVLLREVPVVIGVGSRMARRRHSVVGDGAVLYGERRGTEIVTTITGGCHRLEGIVTLRLPDVVDVEVVATVEIVGIVGTAEGAGEGRGTRDLVAHPAEILVTIELVVDPDKHARRWGYYVEYPHRVDYTAVLTYKPSTSL